MNIEKITALYNAMVQLQELFEDEMNAVDCINGLRLSSSEFRLAFTKVRNTLMQCPVSKAAALTTKTTSVSDKETKTSIPSAPSKTDASKKKPSESQVNYKELEDFIFESYVKDDNSKVELLELLNGFRVGTEKENFSPPVYNMYIYYMKKYHEIKDGYVLGIKPKLDPAVHMLNTPDAGKIFRHPVYTDIWCSEKGEFYHRAPNGHLMIKEPKIFNGSYVIVISGTVKDGNKRKGSVSARRIAFECFAGRELSSKTYVYHRNNNKSDFSMKNLVIKGMQNYVSPEKKYYLDDIRECCEYIASHGKDISNIEADTKFRIGYGFAKRILNKETYRDISDKYF